MTQEKQNVSDGNGVSRPRSNGTPRRRKSPRIQTLVEEAEKLKALLRDAYRQVHQLTVAIRRQGKQSRLVQSTLRSLRALQNVDA